MAKDPVELQLALNVCRKDLTQVQEELNRMKADYWDVVPKRNWDTLEQTHKQNLLQVATYRRNTPYTLSTPPRTHTQNAQFPILTVPSVVLFVRVFWPVQLKRLQGDFDQLKSEYDTLLQLHKRGSTQMETQDLVTVQVAYFITPIIQQLLSCVSKLEAK